MRYVVKGQRVRILFLGVLTLLGLFLLGGERWAQAVYNNYAHLVAQHHLILDPNTEICPKLNFVGTGRDLSWIVNAGAFARSHAFMLYAYVNGDLLSMREFLNHQAQASERDWFWMGCAEWDRGNFETAYTAWKAAKAKGYFLHKAERAYWNKELDRALSLYEIVFRIAPDSVDAWDGVARVQFDRALSGGVAWDLALVTLEKALHHQPNDALAHFRVGYALGQTQNDLPRAEAELRWAWAHNKDWAIAQTLGNVLVRQGKTQEGVAFLEYTLAQSQSEWAYFSLLQGYDRQSRCLEAEETKEKMLTLYPEMQEALRFLCNEGGGCQCPLYP